MNKLLILTMALSITSTTFAQTSTTKAARANSAANINSALQLELGLDSISGESNIGVTTNMAPASTITRDSSTNALRASIRKNYALGSGIYTSIGGTLRISNENQNVLPLGGPTFRTTRNITEVTAEQRLGKLVGLNIFGKKLNLRPFTAISLGARQVAMDYDSQTMRGNSRSTDLVLIPSIGSEFIITSDLTASLTLSQTNIKTEAVRATAFANNFNFSEANDASTIVSLGLAYSF